MEDLKIGKCFNSYQDVDDFIKKYQDENFVVLWKKDCKKIETAQKAQPDRKFEERLVYLNIKFACVHNGRIKSESTGHRSTRTYKTGCGFEFNLRATEDGQALMITKIKSAHNHECTEEEYRSHHRIRKVDHKAKEKIENLLRVHASKHEIKDLIQKETNLNIKMKDIHNIATRMSKETDKTVKGMTEMLSSEFPDYSCDLYQVEQLVHGVFIQDSDMRSVFDKFPELLISDSTYKLNELDMPLYVVVGVDGNGDTQPVCFFIVYKEDHDTITKMLEIFKSKNPKWDQVEVVMTDKDMVERNVFKEQLPQIHLQICLFHVLRTFSREISTQKMNINQSDRAKVLEVLQKLVYAHSPDEYAASYAELRSVAPNRQVLEYYDKNWGGITEQWVDCFKKVNCNFGERTTNRLESLFGKIKNAIKHKSSMLQMIRSTILVLENFKKDKKSNAIYKKVTAPLSSNSVPYGKDYEDCLTDYAFKKMLPQLRSVDDVTVLTENTVQTRIGPMQINESSCKCPFNVTNKLPCKHLIALAKFNGHSTFLIHSIAPRWTKAYTDSRVVDSSVRGETKIHVGEPRQRKVLSANQKFRKVQYECNKAATAMSNMGMTEFNEWFSMLQRFVENTVAGRRISLVEYLPPTPAQQDHEPSWEREDMLEDTTLAPPEPTQDVMQDIAQAPPISTPYTEQDPLVSTPVTQETLAQEDPTESESEPTQDDTAQLNWPEKCRRKGRPRGAHLSAIGLPKKRRKIDNIPFMQQDVDQRRKRVASIFLKDAGAALPYSENVLISESDFISSICKDELFDLSICVDMFTAQAWETVTKLNNGGVQRPWYCGKCKDVLVGESVGCDTCLEWFHLSCMNLPKLPRTKFWYCCSEYH